MKRAHAPSSATVLALAVAVGAAAGGLGTARAAQQEPVAGRGDAGASLIQLEVDVTASGGGEGTGENGRRTWRFSTRAAAGLVEVTAELAELLPWRLDRATAQSSSTISASRCTDQPSIRD